MHSEMAARVKFVDIVPHSCIYFILRAPEFYSLHIFHINIFY